MTYWQRLLAWLGVSEPGTRKEQVEDWLSANGPKLNAFKDRQTSRRAAKKHFFQRVRGWLGPTDDSDAQPNDFNGIPVWCSLSCDVWESPDGARPNSKKGWTLNIHVTEADASEWTLRLDSEDGPLGWTEKKEVIVG
jgi:hypothetical protein